LWKRFYTPGFKRGHFSILSFFFLTLFATIAAAKEGFVPKNLAFTVTGQVKDETHDPLIGANVVLEGTQKGASTDEMGKFTLELTDADKNATLIVSYIGHETQKVALNGRTAIQVTLKSLQSLESIVVSASRKAEKITEANSINSSL
jgi:hypothetical protein